MDLYELGTVIMGDVKSTIEKQYHVTLDDDNTKDTINLLDSEGNVMVINNALYRISVANITKHNIINYYYFKDIGLIFTYYKFQMTEQGTLNIIQGNCLRDSRTNLFANIVCGTTISGLDKCTLEGLIKWPYPFYGPYFEDTIKLIQTLGGQISELPEPEAEENISADGIYTSLIALADNLEKKLNVDQSR